jgi:hypothetical protein
LGVSAFLIAFGLFLFTWQSTQLDLGGLREDIKSEKYILF